MNPPELPGLPAALGLVLFALPFLVLALRFARRLMPPRAAPVHVWPLAQALAVVAAPFATLFALAALGARAEPASAAEPDVLSALFGTQLVLGSGALLALLFAARHSAGLASLGLTVGAPPRAFGGVLLVYLPAWVLFAGLGVAWVHLCRALGWDESQEVLSLMLTLEGREFALAVGVAVLLGPLIEELLFRGFLQPWIGQLAGARAGLVLSSLLFAGLHGAAGLPVLLALSLLLGWLRLRTQSLWLPWFAHALNNAVTLRLALAVSAQ